MKTVKDNIRESINKLEIAQSRLNDNPVKSDVEAAMRTIIEVLNTLEATRNSMIE